MGNMRYHVYKLTERDRHITMHRICYYRKVRDLLEDVPMETWCMGSPARRSWFGRVLPVGRGHGRPFPKLGAGDWVLVNYSSATRMNLQLLRRAWWGALKTAGDASGGYRLSGQSALVRVWLCSLGREVSGLLPLPARFAQEYHRLNVYLADLDIEEG